MYFYVIAKNEVFELQLRNTFCLFLLSIMNFKIKYKKKYGKTVKRAK